MFTPAFEEFVQPARPRAQVWRLLVGIAVIFLVYLIGIIGVFAAVGVTSGLSGIQYWSAIMIEAATPTGTMLLMSSFIGMALGPLVAVRLLHRRRLWTLFGRPGTVRNDFILSSGTVFIVYFFLTVAWSFRFDAVPNLNFSLWLTFLPIALLGLLVQTGAEELIFRGYFQQQLAARFDSPLVWMILPSIAFGLVHYDPNSTSTNVWFIVAAAAAFGLVAADLTRVTGSIGACWGFHFANNVMAVLIIAVDGTIPGLALYLTPYTADDASQIQSLIVADFTGLLVSWFILRRILRR